MNSLKSQKGFSLIEMMVVVTILGVLASIGINSYKSMTYNTRVNQAKSQLTILYSGLRNFHTEWNQYYGDWRNLGTKVQGDLYYRVGFQLFMGNTSPVAPNNYIGPGLSANSPAVAVNSNPNAGNCSFNEIASRSCREIPGQICGLWLQCKWDDNPDRFLLCACSRIRDDSGNPIDDRWTLDEEKNWTRIQM